MREDGSRKPVRGENSDWPDMYTLEFGEHKCQQHPTIDVGGWSLRGFCNLTSVQKIFESNFRRKIFTEGECRLRITIGHTNNKCSINLFKFIMNTVNARWGRVKKYMESGKGIITLRQNKREKNLSVVEKKKNSLALLIPLKTSQVSGKVTEPRRK